MENAIIRFFTIYLVGIAGIWKAIPVGMALKSDPLETAIFTALGSITTVIFMLSLRKNLFFQQVFVYAINIQELIAEG